MFITNVNKSALENNKTQHQHSEHKELSGNYPHD